MDVVSAVVPTDGARVRYAGGRHLRLFLHALSDAHLLAFGTGLAVSDASTIFEAALAHDAVLCSPAGLEDANFNENVIS